jgi:hypothetical protein
VRKEGVCGSSPCLHSTRMFPSILAKKSWTNDVFELEHKKETESKLQT